MNYLQIQQAFTDIETATSIPEHRGGLVLTEWEEDFVKSVHERFQVRGSLTDKQCKALKKIWDKT